MTAPDAMTAATAATLEGAGHSVVDESLVQAFVRERFVHLFLSQSRRAQVGVAACAALITLLWFDPQASGASRWWPLAWLALALAITAWRMVATQSFIAGAPAGVATTRVGIVLGLNGVLMALPVLAFAQLSVLDRSALTIVLVALATASVATTTGYGRLFLAFAAPMLLSLALAWMVVPSTPDSRGSGVGLGLLTLVYLGLLVSLGQQTRLVFEESCRIRFAERRLNERLQQALERESEAHRAKTQFLAAASHDLRQPIHSMSVLVAALGLRDLDPRTREIASLLGTVNQTLSQQLDALLDISRLDAGAVRPDRRPLRLDTLLADHHRTLEPVARERGVRCTLAACERATVLSDGALVLRVIANLSDNALKYTPAGGEVTLSLRCEGSQACLSVADTGIGIPADEQDKVFREFYQVGNVERDRTKGLGLGLSIVQRLSTLLGVQVKLLSTEGQGTTVELRLPLENQAVAAAPAEGEARRLGGLRVLVVDDEPQVLHGMQLLLTELGCEVRTASDTEAAAMVAQEGPLDAVLSDLRLRGDDSGFAALRAVRQVHPGVRAALITGDTAPERIREAQAFGVPVLHKPATAAALVRVLSTGA